MYYENLKFYRHSLNVMYNENLNATGKSLDYSDF